MTGIPLWFIPTLWSFQYEVQRRVSHRHQAHQSTLRDPRRRLKWTMVKIKSEALRRRKRKSVKTVD